MDASTAAYANLLLTFALGMLLAAVTARLSRAHRALESVATNVPTEESVSRYIEGIVERDLPTVLHNVFEDRLARLGQLADDLRRAARREAQDVLERPDFHQKVEKIVQDKLMRGAFATHVKQALDEQYRMLTKYVEEEVLPRAVERKFAESDRIVLAPPLHRVRSSGD